LADAKERAHWDGYQKGLSKPSSITPAPSGRPGTSSPPIHKWFTHVAVADIIISKLKSLNSKYPTVSKERMQELQIAREMLGKRNVT